MPPTRVNPPDPSPAPPQPDWKRTLPLALFVAVLFGATILRFYHATHMLDSSGDVVRNLYYGYLVDHFGLSAAAMPLVRFRGLNWVVWPRNPYIYPVLSLLFFCVVAAVSPTILCAKLALTLVEAANACLVYRYTRSRWLAVLYWASPVSLWWASHEGQFEPVQNLFVLAALCLLERFPMLACLSLALGIQVKVTAVLLLPYFAVKIWPLGRKRVLWCLAAFLLACLPTVATQWQYPITNTLGNLANMKFNPYYWNPWNNAMVHLWFSRGLVFAYQAPSYLVLAVLAWRLARAPRPIEYLAPLLFVLAIKLHTNVQFWYFILWPSFILPISERRVRWALWLATPLLDVSSTMALFGHLIYAPLPGAYLLLRVLTPLTWQP